MEEVYGKINYDLLINIFDETAALTGSFHITSTLHDLSDIFDLPAAN
jgi:hypothetical protein